MANFSPYSNYGYLALIKESTAVTPVTPTNYQRIISESLLPSYNIQPINEVAGDRERNIRSIQGNVEISGDIEFFVEKKFIGHYLRSLFGAPVSQAVSGTDSYRHAFQVLDDDKTYTIDINPANAPWVHRFYGVHISQLAFTRKENAIKVAASTMPTKAFITARVTTAASSGTTLALDQTGGLTTSDTILVLDKDDGYTELDELTISSVDSETQLTTSTITGSLEVGDIVVIKRATITNSSFSQCPPFQFTNGTSVFSGTDVDNSSEVTKEDFQLTFLNDLEARFLSGDDEVDRFPGDVLMKGYSATGQLTKFYDREDNIDKMRANDQFGLRVRMQDNTVVTANAAQKASSTWGATANGFKIEASTAGRAGNDINVTIVVAADDNLAASKSNNNILISLANTTASKNTGTLIAAAVNALSGVDGTAEGTGAEQFTTAESNQNLGFRVDSSGAEAGTNVVGADASQEGYLQFDLAASTIDPYFVNNSEDEIITEEIPLTFYKDSDCTDNQRKEWSTRIFLYNDQSSY